MRVRVRLSGTIETDVRTGVEPEVVGIEPLLAGEDQRRIETARGKRSDDG